MKKLLSFFSLSCLVFLYLENQAFSYDFGSFYSTIAENTTQYDNLIYTTDIEGSDGVASELNKRTGTECFSDSFTVKDLDKMVFQQQIVSEKIAATCKGEDNSISIDVQNTLLIAATDYNNEIVAEAADKTETLQLLTESSIYADGNLENSPFDLMSDIEQLDEIIFERTEEIEYKATKNTDLGDIIKDKLKEKIEDNAKKKIKEKIEKAVNICKLGGDCDSDAYIDQLIEDIKTQQKNPQIFTGVISEQVCPVDNSGLTNVTENIIKNSIKSKQQNTTNVSIGDNGYSIKNTDNQDMKIFSDYTAENDNSLFPCNDFLCIDVKFNTYNHKLLGGWTREYPSIEFLLKRANNHLKPLVNGSLTQSKMTLNNFELSLKDLNLAESFHMGLQVSSKPVPILDIQGEEKILYSSDKKNNTTPVYALENQFDKYYASYGLDYEAPNDLSLFLGYQGDKISTEHAKGLSPEEAVADLQEYESDIQKNYNKTSTIQEAISKKVKNEGIVYLDEQFKEIEIINTGIKDYISSLNDILNQFNTVRQDTSQN